MENRSLEDLEKQEEELSLKLRKLCLFYGDEERSKLRETSEILFSMGRLYIDKTKVTKDVDQMLNFIRGAALLHAARHRFRNHLYYKRKALSVNDALTEMEESLLRVCGGKKPNEPFINISERIKSQFEELRKKEKLDLKYLEIIDESLPEKEAIVKREEKVNHVETLLVRNSENYKKIMFEISEICLKILGDAPCKFAIAGLGSLARREVTLYSDFEHIILLQEGVQNGDNYGKIKDYFRWFSTLFHIIIIGIGETIIPSVAIKSLNDSYSGDKGRDWFFDAYTPAGISFDGMMPHASKNPLGRQGTTEKKSHTVELIQPVSEMVKYLTSEENLKNGYCLKDVLHDMCFVFGQEEICDEFQRCSEKIKRLDCSSNSPENFRKEVKENLCTAISLGPALIGGNNANFKHSLYRPLASLICYLCRLHGVEANSSFNRTRLLDQPEEKTASYVWAFAVACEMRLKLYAFGESSNTKMDGPRILKFIGKSCLTNCVEVIFELSDSFRGSKFIMNPFLRNFEEISIFSVYNFTKDDSGVKRFLNMNDGSNHQMDFNLLSPDMLSGKLDMLPGNLVRELLHAISFIEDETEKSRRLIFIEELILSSKSCEYSYIHRAVLAKVFSLQGRHMEALEVSESIFSDLGSLFVRYKPKSDTILSLRSLQVICAWEALGGSRNVEYCENFLRNPSIDFPSKLIFQFGLAIAHWRQNHADAKILFRELLQEMLRVNKKTKEIPKMWMIWIMHEVYRFQFFAAFYDDCYDTLVIAEEVIQSGNDKVDVDFVAPQFRSYLAIMTWTYAIYSKEDASVAERFKFCEKAVTLAMKLERKAVFLDNNEIFLPIKLLLTSCADDFEEFNVHYFNRILLNFSSYSDLPDHMKAAIVAKFANALSSCLELEVDHPCLLSKLDGALCIVGIVRKLDPLLVPQLWKLCLASYSYLQSVCSLTHHTSHASGRLHQSANVSPIYSGLLPYSETSFGFPQLESLSDSQKAVRPDLFCEAIQQFGTNLLMFLRKEIKREWRKVFFNAENRGESLREFFPRVLGLVYSYHCSEFMFELCNILKKNFDEETLFSSTSDPLLVGKYKDAFGSYVNMEGACIQKFMDIICCSDWNTKIHRKSIVYLNCAILNLLLQNPGCKFESRGDVIVASNVKPNKTKQILKFLLTSETVVNKLLENPLELELCAPLFI